MAQTCFEFEVSPVAGALATITDFSPGDDVIHLSAQAFAGIGAEGDLAVSAFAIGAAASDPAHRILYDPATGALRHDPDGSGPAEGVQFAELGAGLALSHGDFIVIA